MALFTFYLMLENIPECNHYTMPEKLAQRLHFLVNVHKKRDIYVLQNRLLVMFKIIFLLFLGA